MMKIVFAASLLFFSQGTFYSFGIELQSLQGQLGNLYSRMSLVEDYTKLSSWRETTRTLPFNYIQRDFPEGTPSLVDYTTYKKLLEEVAQLNIKQANSVLGNDQIQEEGNYFPLVARRLIADFPTSIYCWGDLHGDIHTLIISLRVLYREGVIRDDFVIAKPNVLFVFNGDYVDRGWFGVAVHAVLCLLRKNNPRNVFLMRGNHEDLKIDKQYGFIEELENKFTEYKQDISELNSTIKLVYDFCPVVMYVGARQGSKHNYLHFCHGALEFYNLRPLLTEKMSEPLYFKRIHSIRSGRLLRQIDRQVELDTYMLSKMLQESGLVNYYKEIKTKEDAFQRAQEGQTIFEDIGHYGALGYMWGDFLQSNRYLAQGGLWGERGLQFEKKLSDILLELPQHKNDINVIAVFRAHQHSKSSMPNLFLKQNRNIYKLPYMDKHFFFTSVATPTMGLPGQGFMKITIQSNDPAKWTLQSFWAECSDNNPTMCDAWTTIPGKLLRPGKVWKAASVTQ